MRWSPDAVAAGRTAVRWLPRAADIDVLLALAAFGALLLTSAQTLFEAESVTS